MKSAPKPTRKELEKALVALLKERGVASVSLSEVARHVRPGDSRGLAEAIRAVAASLQRKGQVDVFEHGRPVELSEAKGPVRLRWRGVRAVDYRKHPEAYRVGRGEQGVLTVEPYKSELLPLWRFATPEDARKSAEALWAAFLAYADAGDFVGMDMARKFLRMGWTRALRYARHASGRKYLPGSREEAPREEDAVKAQSAEIFRLQHERALKDRRYQALLKAHRALEAKPSSR